MTELGTAPAARVRQPSVRAARARMGTGDLHGEATRRPGVFFHEIKDGRNVGETRATHMMAQA